MADSDIVPFRVAFDPGAVDDLRARLRNTRWPERESVDDWSQGIPLAFVQDLARYWCDEYDFGAAQERMNAWPQFTTRIDDLDIHFVHARSPEPDAMPLVITHGWPGSVVEFFDVLGPLTDPVAHGGDAADAFHVVCPSMPGYGFSDRPSTRGRGVPWMAQAWATLMEPARLRALRRAGRRLGLGRDDAPSARCTRTASSASTSTCRRCRSARSPTTRPSSERTNFEDFEWHTRWGTGYQIQQSTRPQTLGYGARRLAGRAAGVDRREVLGMDRL